MGELSVAVGETDHPDVTHLSGDLYFADHYKSRYWLLAGVLCLPPMTPAGVFLGMYLVASCIHTAGEEVTLTVPDG